MILPAVACPKIVRILVPLTAALLAVSASRLPARADASHMLVIPASDGYGFDECLASDKSCGKVIADAWCEAHGMAPSLSFGRADDITASIAMASKTGASGSTGPTVAKAPPGSFIVNCRG
jgi:hypothetical protein